MSARPPRTLTVQPVPPPRPVRALVRRLERQTVGLVDTLAALDAEVALTWKHDGLSPTPVTWEVVRLRQQGQALLLSVMDLQTRIGRLAGPGHPVSGQDHPVEVP